MGPGAYILKRSFCRRCLRLLQCGGINYTGDTTCATGSACVVQNPYYSQCLPGATVSAPAPPTTVSSVSSVTKTSSSVVSSSTPAPPSSTGFVTVSGQKFALNGKEFTVVGYATYFVSLAGMIGHVASCRENSYWVGLMGYSAANINKSFQDIANSGATAVRTW